MASGILTDKYLNKFPKGTRLGVEGLEWLKEKNVTEEKLSKVTALNELANELDMSLPIMSLAWCLKNENVSTVILGASKMSQLKENIKSIDVLSQMDESVMERIEKILENQPEHPTF